MSKYFIIVDMQNDFVTGALKNKSAEAIIPGIVAKAKELKKEGFKIIATRDTHYADTYMKSQEGQNLPIPHCIEGTEGWEVVKEIAPLVDTYVNKTSFGYDSWEEFFIDEMNDNEPEEILMSGTCTSICVASNATILKAIYPETPISVYENLCACLTETTNDAALTVMKAQQVNVI